jgi:hypothetical protein
VKEEYEQSNDAKDRARKFLDFLLVTITAIHLLSVVFSITIDQVFISLSITVKNSKEKIISSASQPPISVNYISLNVKSTSLT